MLTLIGRLCLYSRWEGFPFSSASACNFSTLPLLTQTILFRRTKALFRLSRRSPKRQVVLCRQMMERHQVMYFEVCSSTPNKFDVSQYHMCSTSDAGITLRTYIMSCVQDMVPLLLGRYAAPSRIRRNWMLLAVATPAALASAFYMYRNRRDGSNIHPNLSFFGIDMPYYMPQQNVKQNAERCGLCATAGYRYWGHCRSSALCNRAIPSRLAVLISRLYASWFQDHVLGWC